MEKLFLPYTLSLLCKQKGFDESCMTIYNDEGILLLNQVFRSNNTISFPEVSRMLFEVNEEDIAAPTYNQIINWLIEKHNIYIFSSCIDTSKGMKYFCEIRYIQNNVFQWLTLQDKEMAKEFNQMGLAANKIFETPNEALLEGIEYALSLI